MARNLFTFLFGATLLVVLIMMAQAQPDLEVQGWPTRRPTRPTWRPTPPTRRPTQPTWRPTWRPTPPTRRPTQPTWRPTWRPTPPTRRPTQPTWRPTRPTYPTRRPTRGPRSARAAITIAPPACPRKPARCTTAGPSLCVRSRNGKLCRRVANQCALRNLNCQTKPRNNWAVTNLKGCCKLRVGQRPVNCRDL